MSQLLSMAIMIALYDPRSVWSLPTDDGFMSQLLAGLNKF